MRPKNQFTLWLTVALLLAGCSASDTPHLARLADNDVVLAFGNSLTYGTGANRDQSYPTQLATLINRRVVNAGVPGELSASGLQRLPSELQTYRPQLVILCHGGNDMLRKRSLTALQQNLEQMIATIRASGADVVLIAVPKPGLLLSSADLYQTIATKLELPLEEEALAEILSERELKADAIHPNSRGYRKLAEAIATLFKKTGAI